MASTAVPNALSRPSVNARPTFAQTVATGHRSSPRQVGWRPYLLFANGAAFEESVEAAAAGRSGRGVKARAPAT